MTKTITTIAALFVVKGAGKAARETAFAGIPALAATDITGRDALVAGVKAALGKTPTDDDKAAIRKAILIGRVSTRPIGTPPKMTAMQYAFDLVTRYAAPVAEGKAANKLRAGQLGRRTDAQHRLIRSCEEAISQIMADAGAGAAKTDKSKKKATRAAHRNTPANKAQFEGAQPDHSSLVKKPSEVTADEAVAHLLQQASNLLAYANKYAKVIPTDAGTAVQAFKSAMNAAANAHAVRKATKEAAA